MSEFRSNELYCHNPWTNSKCELGPNKGQVTFLLYEHSAQRCAQSMTEDILVLAYAEPQQKQGSVKTNEGGVEARQEGG